MMPRFGAAARLPALLGLAFGLRLAAVVWLADTVPHSDAAYYDLAARKIAADWGFPFDSSQVEYYGKLGWWPPLYPFFLAALYTVFGPGHRVAVLAQLGLGTLVVALVYVLGRRAAGERAARTAAFLVAVDPTYVFLTNILASENLFVVWFSLGLWLAGRAGAAAARASILAGVAFGLGALTRAIGLVVPFVVALGRSAPGPRARAAAWLLGACALTIAPWTLRNAVVVGSPALVCFGGGLNFYFGHNETGIGYRDLAQTPMAHLTTQAAIDGMGYRLGLQHLAAEPLGFFTRGARKVASLFGSSAYAPHANSAIRLPEGWLTDPVQRREAETLRARQRAKNRWLDGAFTTLADVHAYALLVGALAAALAWRRLPGELRQMTLVCAVWIGAHVAFWAQPRFRYPLDVPLALLAAWTLSQLARPRTRSRREKGPAARATGPKRSSVGGSGCP